MGFIILSSVIDKSWLLADILGLLLADKFYFSNTVRIFSLLFSSPYYRLFMAISTNFLLTLSLCISFIVMKGPSHERYRSFFGILPNFDSAPLGLLSHISATRLSSGSRATTSSWTTSYWECLESIVRSSSSGISVLVTAARKMRRFYFSTISS